MKDGTVYEVSGGTAMAEGTLRRIAFRPPTTVTIEGDLTYDTYWTKLVVKIDGVQYSQPGTWVFSRINEIYADASQMSSARRVFFNGENMGATFRFKPETTSVRIVFKQAAPNPVLQIFTE